MYLNLLFKSIKADAGNMDRVVALVRRFIQVLLSGGGGATEVITGGLYLLGEVGRLILSSRWCLLTHMKAVQQCSRTPVDLASDDEHQ